MSYFKENRLLRVNTKRSMEIENAAVFNTNVLSQDSLKLHNKIVANGCFWERTF